MGWVCFINGSVPCLDGGGFGGGFIPQTVKKPHYQNRRLLH